MEQVRHLYRGVGQDCGSGALDGQIVQVLGREHVGVLLPPSKAFAGPGDGDEGILGSGFDAVLRQQLAQFLRPDAPLTSLDPAYLRRIALQNAGRQPQVVAEALPVAAQ